jgi:phosphatidylinositol kinase/protein kinase (PI-3  family)
LLRSAAGPEAFLTMRSNFTSSLAAVSASSYVAGVGDRHLQVQPICD